MQGMNLPWLAINLVLTEKDARRALININHTIKGSYYQFQILDIKGDLHLFYTSRALHHSQATIEPVTDVVQFLVTIKNITCDRSYTTRFISGWAVLVCLWIVEFHRSASTRQDGPIKDAMDLHYGNLRSQCFGAWPTIGKSCSAASIIRLCWFFPL